MSEEDRRFNIAFENLLNSDRSDYPNLVGGIQFASGLEYKARSPLDEGILIGNFQIPEPGMVKRAVPFATEAFAVWSSLPLSLRAERMKDIRDDLVKSKNRIEAAITLSVGMTSKQSRADMDRLIEVMDGCLEEVDGMPSGANAMGVWAVIGSYQSPVASLFANVFAALLAGNTVIMCPSHLCPLPAYIIFEMMVRRGLPDGALNLLTDPHGKTQLDLVNNPDIVGVCISGSAEDSEEMMFAQVDDELSFHSEIKGMNPAIISQRSDLKYAAEAVLESAFSYSGQRLDSCSKVIVLDSHYEQFLNLLLKGVKDITVGDPVEEKVFTGPVINKKKMNQFLEIMDDARSYLLYGGDRLTKGFLNDGYFVKPAIVVGLPDDHELNNMDHSLPILSVQRASDLDDAIEKANACEFGLSAGIFTKDEKEMEKFLALTHADSAYVNGPSLELGPALKVTLSNFMC